QNLLQKGAPFYIASRNRTNANARLAQNTAWPGSAIITSRNARALEGNVTTVVVGGKLPAVSNGFPADVGCHASQCELEGKSVAMGRVFVRLGGHENIVASNTSRFSISSDFGSWPGGH